MYTHCLIAALALTAACDRQSGTTAEKPAEVQHAVAESQLTTVRLSAEAVTRLGLETATVDTATAALTRTLGGTVVVPPGLTLTIAAPVAGTVLAPEGALPAAGSHVARGQPLLRLVGLPRSEDLIAARVRFEQTKAEAERMARLFADGLVSGRDNERAQADYAAARAVLDAAAAHDGIGAGDSPADPAFAPLVIRAPEAGLLWELHVAPGQSVAAGDALGQVIRLDRLWVRVPVYAGEVGQYARGNVIVHGLGSTGATGFSAAPVRAPPSADPMAASVDLHYEVRSPGGVLRPGERVSVTLPLAGAVGSGLAVPLAAVVYDLNGGAWVYERLDSLTFARRRVEIDRIVGDLAMLTRGPARGTVVVTAGAAELFGAEFGIGK